MKIYKLVGGSIKDMEDKLNTLKVYNIDMDKIIKDKNDVEKSLSDTVNSYTSSSDEYSVMVDKSVAELQDVLKGGGDINEEIKNIVTVMTQNKARVAEIVDLLKKMEKDFQEGLLVCDKGALNKVIVTIADDFDSMAQEINDEMKNINTIVEDMKKAIVYFDSKKSVNMLQFQTDIVNALTDKTDKTKIQNEKEEKIQFINRRLISMMNDHVENIKKVIIKLRQFKLKNMLYGSVYPLIIIKDDSFTKKKEDIELLIKTSIEIYNKFKSNVEKIDYAKFNNLNLPKRIIFVSNHISEINNTINAITTEINNLVITIKSTIQ